MTNVDYKQNILNQLIKRNETYNQFTSIISCCEHYSVENHKLRYSNKALQTENNRLAEENSNLKSFSSKSNVSQVDRSEQVANLEQKLIKTQAELVEIQRTKGARIQQIADLNIALREIQQENKNLADSLESVQGQLKTLASSNATFEAQLSSEKAAKDLVQNEYTALLASNTSTEEKLRIKESEFNDITERYLKLKNEHANIVNNDNDRFKPVSNAQTKKELAEAMQDVTTSVSQTSLLKSQQPKTTSEVEQSSSQNFIKKFTDLFNRGTRIEHQIAKDDQKQPMRIRYGSNFDCYPDKVDIKWKAHESEVSSLRSSNSGGSILATGGFDKMLHIWNFVGNQARLQSTLRGCNGGITSIDFDPSEQLLCASSNDCAARIWHMNTQRLRLTLTGHDGKVCTAKFLGATQRLATGGHDRTVKVWDARSGACLQTFAVGSTCTDLISADQLDCIVSGHFDKKLRVWDARSNHRTCINEISVGGRVTCVDIPMESDHTLVCCTKDHTLELVDLRKRQVVNVFRDDSFKVSNDLTRCAFSPGANYLAVGSTDGSVITWNAKNFSAPPSINFGPHKDPVWSCNWRSGKLVTSDRNRCCAVWTSNSLSLS